MRNLTIVPTLLVALLTLTQCNNSNSSRVKSAKVEFRYHNTVKDSEIFEGVNYFDNYGKQTLTVFNEKRGTDILKILKRDATEYNFPESNWFAANRSIDICTDPIIELNGTDNYCGDYTTSNRRDTIYNKMKCSAYDLVFTKNKSKGLLITYNNIKMYYYYNFEDIKNMYSVTSIDTNCSNIKTELFEIPK